MLDHFGMGVRDYPAARAFYARTLEPLGMTLAMETTAAEHGHDACGFGRSGNPKFWVSDGAASTALHIAFRAQDRQSVDAFHAAALSAGGLDNGGPGLRPGYHPHYYAAFVWDLDGNNIEAVCHAPGDAADQRGV